MDRLLWMAKSQCTAEEEAAMKTVGLILLVSLVYGSLLGLGVASAAEISVVCTPTGVATYPSRIHIRCAQSFAGIVFFAYGSRDASGAARNMSMATSALIAGRSLVIFYDPADRSGTRIGCLAHDCRVLTGLEIF